MSASNQVLRTSSQLGQLLQASRRAQKLSQASLAAKVGLSQSRVSHLEQHAEEMSLAQLMSWCAALGLELTLGPRGGTPGADVPTDW